ncbi:nuclease-related domain-containing protein [Clostridium sp. FP1]|nr:nuclease-related domain-containing protein [Clostridium sp. FP1]
MENKTTQIDHVIVSNYGIFVIETKNYKGWIIGNEFDENWK